jgi:hypothetical protein
MNKSNLSQEKIAQLLSMGNFEPTFPYLSEQITWDVVGKNLFQGKPEVINNCMRTAEYFNSVQTNFVTDDIIVTDNKVVIKGTGEFLREGKRVNLITACDVYEFNRKNELKKITSYCIPEKK